MKILREKDRTILSLTPKELKELRNIIATADDYSYLYPTRRKDAEEVKEHKALVATLRKWCKAFGLKSIACLEYED